VVVAVTGSGQLGKTAAPVVDSGLMKVARKDGLCESGLYKFDAGEVNLGKIELGSRYAGIYKLRLCKSANNGLCSLSSIP
jgi:hypothetical protein